MSEMNECAACGKTDDVIKTCTACKLVKYCNKHCQRAHRCEHKNECMKVAAELHDEALFKPSAFPEECPFCMFPMPIKDSDEVFQQCCGEHICAGCGHQVYKDSGRKGWPCPFCKTPGLTT